LSSYFESVIVSLNIHNVFNPSFYCDDGVRIIAFRAIVNGEDCLTSFVSVEDRSGRRVKKISVDSYRNLNEPRLIDPKVIKLCGEHYVTFNSGWVPGGNNIYIMKVYPEMGSPKRLVYKNRQVQERNWAFFSQQNEIYVLYWINPLKILRVNLRGTDTWEVDDHYHGKIQNGHLPVDLTIGTQLSRFNKQYCFVAHQKRIFQNKKIYLGKFCTFSFRDKTVTPGRYWLVHSLESLSGCEIKHNTNLFSCTYFSGIQVSGRSVKLGYGINDVEFGFSTHQPDDL
jgi:hypothetical protein